MPQMLYRALIKYEFSLKTPENLPSLLKVERESMVLCTKHTVLLYADYIG